MHIIFKSDEVNYKIEFNRRLTIIKGNSGTGKTTLYENIREHLTKRAIDTYLESSLEIILSDELRWVEDLETKTNKIILFDDIDIIQNYKFCTKYKECVIKNNLWIIFMTREDSIHLKTDRLSYSIHSIYRLKNNGKVIINVPLYNFGGLISKPDCIIVEDKNAGYTFFVELYKGRDIKIISSHGKSNIVTEVEKALKAYKNILVFLDTSAYGCHIEEYYLKIERKYGNRVSFVSFYECFEYLLLCTNILNRLEDVRREFKNINISANMYLSWEHYFEDVLKKVTENKFYKQSHRSKLNSCYYENCNDCNTHKKEKCDYGLDGNKFINLLVGTRFEFLLRYL